MDAIKVTQINTKGKTDLIKKVSKLNLSKKHDKLYQKILEKGLKNWSDDDIEFLRLLVDIHYFPRLNFGGICICPLEQAEEIEREAEIKRENALKRLTDEPYSLWLKNVRNYKKNQLL